MNANLKPLKKGQKRTKEAIQKQKETIAHKKLIKEIASEVLCRIRDKRSNKTVKDEIVDALINKALQGDLKAIELVMKVVGEAPKEQIEISTPITEVKLISSIDETDSN